MMKAIYNGKESGVRSGEGVWWSKYGRRVKESSIVWSVREGSTRKQRRKVHELYLLLVIAEDLRNSSHIFKCDTKIIMWI
jgi:hypothetical protein